MAELNLTPETQQILLEMQTFQQQMQTVLMQKERLGVQGTELEEALVELKKSSGEEVYKAVGPILIKSTKTELETELSEKKESVELRLKSLQKQEERLKDKLKEVQGKFEDFLKSAHGHEGHSHPEAE